MRIAEMERLLKREGFWLLRDNGKHPIWTDGYSKITLPTGGSSINVGLSKAIKLQLRRALARRPAVPPKPKPKEEDFMQYVPKALPPGFANRPTIVEETPKTPSPEPTPPAAPSLGKKTHKELWEAIKPMRLGGTNYREIADRLNAMGYLTPTGKPIGQSLCAWVAVEYGGRDFKTRDVKRKKKKEKDVEESAVAAPPANTQASSPAPDSTPSAPPIVAPIAPKAPEDEIFIQIADIAMSNLSRYTKIALIRDMLAKT